MKNIFKLLFTASILLFTYSCTDGEHLASYDHSGEVEYGAVLRTIDDMPSNSLINTSYDDSAFIVTVEEQDIEDGGLLQEMRISVVYDDYTPDNEEESRTWTEGLTNAQFEKLQKFFETMPSLRHVLKVKNPKTKKMNEVVLEGLSDFFA